MTEPSGPSPTARAVGLGEGDRPNPRGPERGRGHRRSASADSRLDGRHSGEVVSTPLMLSSDVPGLRAEPGGVHIHPASNLVIFAKIGDAELRVILDTGAARSIMRTRVSQGLAKDPRSADAMKSRHRITNQVRCEGVEKGRQLPRLEHVACFDLTLLGFGGGAPDKQKQVTVEVTACELDECAEPLIVGLQDLQRWGMELLPSPQPDRPLASFNKLDLTVQSTGEID